MSEASVDMQVILDRSGRFIYVNPSFCRATGYTREQLLNLTVSDVDPDFTASKYEALYAELGESEPAPFESTLLHTDRSETPVEISVGPVSFDGQRFTFATLRDISELIMILVHPSKVRNSAP